MLYEDDKVQFLSKDVNDFLYRMYEFYKDIDTYKSTVSKMEAKH